MADAKISELAAAGALTGAESVEAVQGGVNVKTTTAAIAALASASSILTTTITNGDTTHAPDGNAVFDALVLKEDAANKATTFGTINNTLYPTVQAVEDRINSATAGLKWKASVRVATTVAGTLASSFENGDTIDGVVLATGNRILIKNQADQTTNGIYTVNASGAPTRSTDADAAAELESAAVSVQEGTSNANTTWLQTTDNITLGVSNIVWTAFGSSVPDADASTKGIAKLYPSTSLGTNTDGAPDQNAVKAYADAKVSDTAYAGSWDGVTTIAPSKNAVYDKIETMDPVGVQDLFIPASAMWPRTTGGCASLVPTEMATSLFNIQSLDFDQTTQEYAQFQLTLPRKYNNSTITFRPYWTAVSGSGGVVWSLSGGAYSDDDALTVAFGTAQTSTDTLIATNDLHIGAESSAITLAGSPADADFLGFQITRVTGDGSDTLTADAKLLGISLRITVDAGKDA